MKKLSALVLALVITLTCTFGGVVSADTSFTIDEAAISTTKVADTVSVDFGVAVNEASLDGKVALTKDSVEVPIKVAADGTGVKVSYGELVADSTYTLTFKAGITSADGTKTLAKDTPITINTNKSVYRVNEDFQSYDEGKTFSSTTAAKFDNSDLYYKGAGKIGKTGDYKYFETDTTEIADSYLYDPYHKAVTGSTETLLTEDFAVELEFAIDGKAGAREFVIASGNNAARNNQQSLTVINGGSESLSYMMFQNTNQASPTIDIVGNVSEGAETNQQQQVNFSDADSDGFNEVRMVAGKGADGNYDMEVTTEATCKMLDFDKFESYGSFSSKVYNSSTTTGKTKYGKISIYRISPLEILKSGWSENETTYDITVTDDITTFGTDEYLNEDNYDAATRTFKIPAASIRDGELTVSLAGLKTDDGAFNGGSTTITIPDFGSKLIIDTNAISTTKVADTVSVDFGVAVNEASLNGKVALTKDSVEVPIKVAADGTGVKVSYGELVADSTYTLTFKAGITSADGTKTLAKDTPITINTNQSVYRVNEDFQSYDEGKTFSSTTAAKFDNSDLYYKGAGKIGKTGDYKYFETDTTEIADSYLYDPYHKAVTGSTETLLTEDFAVELEFAIDGKAGAREFVIASGNNAARNNQQSLTVINGGSESLSYMMFQNTNQASPTIDIVGTVSEGAETNQQQQVNFSDADSDGFNEVRMVAGKGADGNYDMEVTTEATCKMLDFDKFESYGSFSSKVYNSSTTTGKTKYGKISIYRISPLEILKSGWSENETTYDITVTDDITTFGTDEYLNEDNYDAATRTFKIPAASIRDGELTVSLAGLKTDDGAFNGGITTITIPDFGSKLIIDTNAISTTKVADTVSVDFGVAVNEASLDGKVALTKDSVEVPIKVAADGTGVKVSYGELVADSTYTLTFKAGITSADGTKTLAKDTPITINTNQSVYRVNEDFQSYDEGKTFSSTTAAKFDNSDLYYKGAGKIGKTGDYKYFETDTTEIADSYLYDPYHKAVTGSTETLLTEDFAVELEFAIDGKAGAREFVIASGNNAARNNQQSLTVINGGSESLSYMMFQNTNQASPTIDIVGNVSEGAETNQQQQVNFSDADSDGFNEVRMVAGKGADGNYDMEVTTEATCKMLDFDKFESYGSFSSKVYNSSTTTGKTKYGKISIYRISPLEILKSGWSENETTYDITVTDDIAVFGTDEYLNEDNYDAATRTFKIPAASIRDGELTVSLAGLKTDDGAFNGGSTTITIPDFGSKLIIDGAAISTTKVADTVSVDFGVAVNEASLDGKVALTKDSVEVPIKVAADGTGVKVSYGELVADSTYTLTFKAGITSADGTKTLAKDTPITINTNQSVYRVNEDFQSYDEGKTFSSTTVAKFDNSDLYYSGAGKIGTVSGTDYKYFETDTTSITNSYLYDPYHKSVTGSTETLLTEDFAFEFEFAYGGTGNAGSRKFTIASDKNAEAPNGNAQTFSIINGGASNSYLLFKNSTKADPTIDIAESSGQKQVNITADDNDFYKVKMVACVGTDGVFDMEVLNGTNTTKLDFDAFPSYGSFMANVYNGSSTTGTTKYGKISIYRISPLEILKSGWSEDETTYDIIVTDDIAVFGTDEYLNENNYDAATRTFKIPAASIKDGEATLSLADLRTDDGAFGDGSITITIPDFDTKLIIDTNAISTTKLADSVSVDFGVAVNEASLDGKVALTKDSVEVPIKVAADGTGVKVSYGELVADSAYTLTFKAGIKSADGTKTLGNDTPITINTNQSVYRVNEDFQSYDEGKTFSSTTAAKFDNSDLYYSGAGKIGKTGDYKYFETDTTSITNSYLYDPYHKAVTGSTETLLTEDFAFEIEFAYGGDGTSSAGAREFVIASGNDATRNNQQSLAVINGGSAALNYMLFKNTSQASPTIDIVGEVSDGAETNQQQQVNFSDADSDGFNEVRMIASKGADGNYDMEVTTEATCKMLDFDKFESYGSFMTKLYNNKNNASTMKYGKISIYRISPLEILKSGWSEDETTYEITVTDDIAVFGMDEYLNENNYDAATRTFKIPAASIKDGEATLSLADLRTDDGAFNGGSITVTVPNIVGKLSAFTTSSETITLTISADVAAISPFAAIAVYNEKGMLQKVITSQSTETTVTLDISDLNPSAGWYAKGFIWESASNIKPITGALTRPWA